MTGCGSRRRGRSTRNPHVNSTTEVLQAMAMAPKNSMPTMRENSTRSCLGQKLEMRERYQLDWEGAACSTVLPRGHTPFSLDSRRPSTPLNIIALARCLGYQRLHQARQDSLSKVHDVLSYLVLL